MQAEGHYDYVRFVRYEALSRPSVDQDRKREGGAQIIYVVINWRIFLGSGGDTITVM